MLVWAFVEASAVRMGKTIKKIPRKTMEGLQGYSWPGNVRELSNVIERAMIITTGDTLQVDVPSIARSGTASRITLKDHERELILEVLEGTRWRLRGPNGAAEILGVKPTTLEARMARLGIKRGGRPSNLS